MYRLNTMVHQIEKHTRTKKGSKWQPDKTTILQFIHDQNPLSIGQFKHVGSDF